MRLVDTATAAVAAGVTDRTIRNWVKAKRLTNHGTAKHIRVSVDDAVACRRDFR